MPFEGYDLARYQNTAYLLESSGRMNMRYNKVHLFPFGERMPLQEVFPFMRLLNPHPFEMVPGQHTQAPMSVALENLTFEIVSSICYEDIIPDSLRLRLSQSTPQIIVNLTNDAWFPHTRAQVQHHYLALMRAIEFRRPLLRTSVNGITGVIESTGRQKILPSNTRASLFTETRPTSGFTWYALLGDWPLTIICILACLLHLRKSKK